MAHVGPTLLLIVDLVVLTALSRGSFEMNILKLHIGNAGYILKVNNT